MQRTIISGTGSYIPSEVKTNRDFTVHDFFTAEQARIATPPEVVVEKFKQITGIEERRYVSAQVNTSDIAAIAAERAIEESGIDPEALDQIILAHNFGDVVKHTVQTDAMPALAARVKHRLDIKNPNCIAYDVLFGCPGWIQGLVLSDTAFKAGTAKHCLVIGAETLSRVLDPYDRDSMIFSDGAGASVLSFEETGEAGSGILSHVTQSHCIDELEYLFMGGSNFPESDPRLRFIKMKGRKVYEYALKHVPAAMKVCLEKAGADIHDVRKIFIHQANEKLDAAMIKALFRLYGLREVPEGIMPMSIHKLGNSSVATVPTLYDLVRKGQLEGHALAAGDLIVFASVGAGMNINAVCYRV